MKAAMHCRSSIETPVLCRKAALHCKSSMETPVLCIKAAMQMHCRLSTLLKRFFTDGISTS